MTKEGQVLPTDAIKIRRTQPGENGEPVVVEESVVMPLPQWRSKFKDAAPVGLLPEGLSLVDTTNVDPKSENSHIIVAGEKVGGRHVIPLHEGTGAIEMRPGQEVVVDATSLTDKLRGNGSFLRAVTLPRGRVASGR